jgi:predicted RNA binding protein YcfA (HicA-like mRNA interferase family)
MRRSRSSLRSKSGSLREPQAAAGHLRARVVRALEKDGFDIIGTKGSHCKLRRGSRTVIVPLHDEVRPGTLASILRAADMSADRLRDLL